MARAGKGPRISKFHTQCNSSKGLFEPGQDGILQRDAMIAEGMISFYLDMQGLRTPGLLERFQQSFAVRPAAVICRNQ
jgi:hypothetical protein